MSIAASPPAPPSSPAWMSWWDRYLAPGDLRKRTQITPTTTHPAHPTAAAAAAAAAAPQNGAPDTITPAGQRQQQHTTGLDPAHRRRRQNALFLGGLTFTLLSLSLTRRTIHRKRLAAHPSTFTPSHMHIQPPPNPQQQMSRVEGSLLAAEALGLATLNVVSVFMAGIGGAMAWFDVSEVEDLRRRVDLSGEMSAEDEEAEREVEGWIAGALGGGRGEEELKEGEEAETLRQLGGESLRRGVAEKLRQDRAEKGGQGGDLL